MHIRTIAVLAILSTTACTTPVADDTDAPPEESLHDALQGEHHFDIAADTAVAIQAQGSWINDHGTPETLELPLRGGVVSVIADGDHLTLSRLTLELEDLEIGASAVTPQGGALTNLRLILERPVHAGGDYAGDTARAADTLDLRLEWALDLPLGPTIDLGSPEIAELPFDLSIEGSPDDLQLALDIAHEGELMALDELVNVTAITAAIVAE